MELSHIYLAVINGSISKKDCTYEVQLTTKCSIQGSNQSPCINIMAVAVLIMFHMPPCNNVHTADISSNNINLIEIKGWGNYWDVLNFYEQLCNFIFFII